LAGSVGNRDVKNYQIRIDSYDIIVLLRIGAWSREHYKANNEKPQRMKCPPD